MAIDKIRVKAGDPAAGNGEWVDFYVNRDTGSLVYFNPVTEAVAAAGAVTEVTTATDTLTASDSGKVIFLNSATEFVTTLPAPAAGLRFTFIVKAAPASASYTIVTNGGDDVIFGCAASSADAGGSVDSTAGTGADTITFVDGQAQVGDRVDLISDGTNWYATGICADEDAITFTAS